VDVRRHLVDIARPWAAEPRFVADTVSLKTVRMKQM